MQRWTNRNWKTDKEGHTEVYRKLAEYEDLEEQGLLVKLPCKLGDTIYHISDNNIKEEVITKVDYDIRNNKIDLCNSFVCTNDIYDKEDNFYQLEKFGKSVFLTRSEAKKKLKEIELEHRVNLVKQQLLTTIKKSKENKNDR